jgi:hypothetical protein
MTISVQNKHNARSQRVRLFPEPMISGDKHDLPRHVPGSKGKSEKF